MFEEHKSTEAVYFLKNSVCNRNIIKTQLFNQKKQFSEQKFKLCHLNCNYRFNALKNEIKISYFRSKVQERNEKINSF